MNGASDSSQVNLIREVFSYTNRFHGRTFVLHIDFGAVDDSVVGGLVQDLVLLQRAGIRVVLVPGARRRIDEVLERYGVEWKRHRGVRIATAEAIPFIKMAAFDVANRLMTLLSAHNSNAVVGNWVRARGLGVIDGVNHEHAGAVERIQIDLIQSTLDEGLIPIFPCIGWSFNGKPYNISSRELAFRIAVSLKAEKLFFVSDRIGIAADPYKLPEGVDVAPDGRISRMDIRKALRFLELNGIAVSEGENTSGYFEGSQDDLELVRLAYEATREAVNRVHIVDGRRDGVLLLEVFSNLGVGTMIHANVYQSIRPMTIDDVPEAYRLLRPLAEQGVLVRRTEEEIAANHGDFVVHETDGRLHACGALHEYPGGTAEIAAIAIDPAYEALGIGRRIVEYLIDESRRRGLRSVFALTTQTTDWFESLGFQQISIKELPEEKRLRYDPKRRSVALRLEL